MGNLGLEVREICSQSRTIDLVFNGDGDLSSLSVEEILFAVPCFFSDSWTNLLYTLSSMRTVVFIETI